MEGDNTSEEMVPAGRQSESSRLVMSNETTKPSYINLIGNICAVIFCLTIIFCCFKDQINFFSFHPVLMSLGWLILMSSAINAVTPGDMATEWMPIRLRSARHWVIQVLTSVIVIIGFLMILIHKFVMDKPHFVTLHAKFGLTSFIMMFVTMSGGLCALNSLNLKKYLAPIYIKLIHAFVGVVTFLLGLTTAILGLFSQWWSFGESLRYTNLILILVVLIVTILRPSLKIFFRLKERLDNLN